MTEVTKYVAYLVRLPISEVQADNIGMPREIFEQAVKIIGRRVTGKETRQMQNYTNHKPREDRS